MPNGNDFSIEEWDKFESPLRRLDPILQKFSTDNNMQISKNYHEWPSRELEYTDEIKKRIIISLDSKNETHYSFLINAYYYKKKKLFDKTICFIKNKPIEEIENDLENLILYAFSKLNEIKKEDLIKR